MQRLDSADAPKLVVFKALKVTIQAGVSRAIDLIECKLISIQIHDDMTIELKVVLDRNRIPADPVGTCARQDSRFVAVILNDRSLLQSRSELTILIGLHMRTDASRHVFPLKTLLADPRFRIPSAVECLAIERDKLQRCVLDLYSYGWQAAARLGCAVLFRD